MHKSRVCLFREDLVGTGAPILQPLLSLLNDVPKDLECFSSDGMSFSGLTPVWSRPYSHFCLNYLSPPP